MYEAPPVTTPTGTRAAELADQAIAQRLTVYAGAGISADEPAFLPGASRLAELISAEIASAIALDGVEHDNLVAVADAVAREPGGVGLLKSTILRVVPMTMATPNHSHVVLALLLLEGAITVLETNYDNCIERAAVPELVPVVVTDTDRLDMDKTALLKVHGCATRPATMRVTSAELANVPLFAGAELRARLTTGPVAFIGIGSPADYVGSTLETFASRVSLDKLYVVGPQTIDWVGSGWPAILPGLPEEQRIAQSADDFTDAVLRAYLMRAISMLRQKVVGLAADHPQRAGVEALIQAFEPKDAAEVLRWLRQGSWRFPPGSSVAFADGTFHVLVALGALGGGAPIRVLRDGWVNAQRPEGGEGRVLVLNSSAAPLGTDAAAEARRRVMDARAEERIDAGADVVVVCHGQLGLMGADQVHVAPGARLADVIAARDADHALAAMPANLLANEEVEHLIDSATAGRMILVATSDLIEAA